MRQFLDEMDGAAGACSARMPQNAQPLPAAINVLNPFSMVSWGFSANLNDYYAPDNSYLHVVLSTGVVFRYLALLWLELAQAALGLKAYGVSLPRAFSVVKVLLPGGQAVSDPDFYYALSREALSERLEAFRQHQGRGYRRCPLGLRSRQRARNIFSACYRNLEIHHFCAWTGSISWPCGTG